MTINEGVYQIAAIDDLTLMREARDLKLEISTLEKRLDSIKSHLKEKIGDKEFMTDNFGTILISYSSSLRNQFDLDRFKKENSELYEGYMIQKTQRTLLIK